ncbi:RagB/SusD family nutrient uptake outer membrane protein [Aggregatimonas sangjinii]|uniref:RagB/SusD family nutrient uptake outer membrane protein n=1 Tax=Aggregatimonas sangjinii TaxID=2583587 RepID=A0A5B7SJL4_9FLAO|nr:RagB/SusD family nutrient uptake outer membrane protein [Aggregatimonas sangjinii]QCW98644.1 RagB/SusD family nutrient uptake outer membrane protein [Aggregatimonas sangjinii]
MKNLYKLTFLSSMLVLAYSCTDLEETLEDELTTEFSDDGVSVIEGATAGGIQPPGSLLGAYGGVRAGTAGHGSYYSVQTVSSDEMAIGQKGGDWFDGGIWLRMHRHTVGSANGPLNDTWNNAFNGIGQANTALAGSLSPNETAQARTIRAYQYFRLMDLFGRVKIVTSTDTGANSSVPQSERSEVFAFVESELLAALGIPAVTASMDLSGSDLGTASDPYIINQYAVLGILAKLYLNAEVYTGTPRYEEAEWAASYIIDNGPYQLCADGCSVPNLAKRPDVEEDPDNLEGYAAIFAPNNQFNPEMIWSIYYDAVSAGGMNFSQMNMHYSSQLTYSLDQQPWNGYQVLEEFYNSYDDDDLRKEANFLAGPQTDFSGNALLDFAADDDDLVVNYTPAINELEPNSERESGTRAKKFSFQLFGRQEMNNDYPIVRLGDVHLMRGEARARAAGDWSLSLDDVNAIRDRAGLEGLDSIDADTFFEERGKEMFQEGSRRTDRIRFGKWGESWWEKTNSDSFRTIFPIPQEQINASEGTLTQNPGY